MTETMGDAVGDIGSTIRFKHLDNNKAHPYRSPHTLAQVLADAWDRPYSREKAAYPALGLRDRKVWPTVARVDNMFGYRNVCSRLPVSAHE